MKITSYAQGTPCWVDLATTDPTAAKDFYADLFGWAYQDNPMDETGEIFYSMAMTDGSFVGGMYEQPEDQRQAGIPPHWLIHIAVDDVDATAARVPGLAVPTSRSQVSPRPYPAQRPPLPYGPEDQVRRVQAGGWVSFQGRHLRLPKALRGQPVAFRPTATDGCWAIRFLTDDLGTLDLRAPASMCKPCLPTPVNHLSGLDTRGEGRGEGPVAYADVPSFCKSASLDEVRKHGHVLTPGRYVGAEPQQDDGEPFEEKMARPTKQWREQQAEVRRLDAAIEANLARLRFLTREEDTDG